MDINVRNVANKATVLVVDDTPDNLALLSGLLKEDYKVLVASNGEMALKIATKNPPDLILLDIMMPGLDGYEVCQGLKSDPKTRDIPVIFLTAKAKLEDEQKGLELGAVDYITRPISPTLALTRIRTHIRLKLAHDTLGLIVSERTAELRQTNVKLLQEIAERKGAEESLLSAFEEIKRLKDRLQAENIYLQQEIACSYDLAGIIGQKDGLSSVFSLAEQVAPQNATVLILGETGTGKGVVARAIHSISARKDRPMITVNCAALPANLIESELFGREKGAFTGANARQIGRFELADGGTIFLDEIGEMPMELQCKLLRVIQEGEFERLGSPRTIKIDLRIIAASNRNLADEIKNGSFRADLFYRLNVFPITIPPLRQRKGDIPSFVNHFVAKFNKKIGKKVTTVSTDNLKTLQEYQWPGNVRELESVIERAVILSQGAELQVLDRLVNDALATAELVGNDVKALAELERDHIIKVLQKTSWRIEGANGAAVILGLNPSTLRARIRKFHIVRQ